MCRGRSISESPPNAARFTLADLDHPHEFNHCELHSAGGDLPTAEYEAIH